MAKSPSEVFEQSFLAWLPAQPGVRAVVVVGSRGRPAQAVDEWSDLDYVLFVDDLARYASQADWLKALGEVWLKGLRHTGHGDPEWQVIYAGGLKVDFVFTRADLLPGATVRALLNVSPYAFVFQRGARAIYPASEVIPASPVSAALPGAAEFANLLALMWLDATTFARLWQRADWWRAKQMLDCQMKEHLLTAVEWHARAVRGVPDTWYEGRHLAHWADARAVAALPQTFASLDAGAMRAAFFETLGLFRWLARETALKLGYAYPADVDRQITERLLSN